MKDRSGQWLNIYLSSFVWSLLENIAMLGKGIQTLWKMARPPGEMVEGIVAWKMEGKRRNCQVAPVFSYSNQWTADKRTSLLLSFSYLSTTIKTKLFFFKKPQRWCTYFQSRIKLSGIHRIIVHKVTLKFSLPAFIRSKLKHKDHTVTPPVAEEV